jgi:hypothetical protein
MTGPRTAFFMIAFVLGATSPLVAQEPDPSLLTTAETDFLFKNCPETTQLVSSGVVVAYGKIITPPFLIAVDRDMVYAGGVRILPREEKPNYYRAKKRVDEIQTQYFLDKKAGIENPESLAKQRAAEMQKGGRASSIEFLSGKIQRLSVSVDGTEWHWGLDVCPSSVNNKHEFIVWQLGRSFFLRKQTAGKEAAWAWLRARFEDLKMMGMVRSYDIHDTSESVYFEFDCKRGKWGTSFYDPITPREIAYEKSWKAKEPETQRLVTDIVQHLRAGEILVYSHSFDTHISAKPDGLNLLRRIQQDHGGKEAEKLLEERLDITTEQAKTLVEELE